MSRSPCPLTDRVCAWLTYDGEDAAGVVWAVLVFLVVFPVEALLRFLLFPVRRLWTR